MDDTIDLRGQLLNICQGRLISPNDLEFWQDFWAAPLDATEISNIKDLNSIRDQNLPNFLCLIRACAEKVVYDSNNRYFNSLELLNCIRLLHYLLPCAYELPEYTQQIEKKLFWSKIFDPSVFVTGTSRTSTVPILSHAPKNITKKSADEAVLGSRLVTALVELLFTDKFTIDGPNWKTLSTVSLWESGIGGTVEQNRLNFLYLSNRTDVLRLLLTLTSTPMYEKVTQLMSSGSRFSDFLVSGLSKNAFLSLVSSLFNFMARRSRITKIKPGAVNEVQMELMISSLLLAGQLLALLSAYHIPSKLNQDISSQTIASVLSHSNMARYFFSTLKNSDLNFALTSLIDIMKTPLETIPSENEEPNFPSVPSALILSSIVILWELFKCNPHCQSLILERHLSKLIIALLFHVYSFHDVPQHSQSVKVATYFLLSLSGQEIFVKEFIRTIPDELIVLLPLEFRLRAPISLRDFVVIHTCQILVAITPQVGGKVSRILPSLRGFLYLNLTEMLYNIIPVTNSEIIVTSDPSIRLLNINPKGGISYLACQSVIAVISLFSTRDFLKRDNKNADLLAILLRSICSASIKCPEASSCLLLSLLENESIFSGIFETINQFNDEFFCYESGLLRKVDEKVELSPNPSLTSNVESNVGSPLPDTIQELESLNSPTYKPLSPVFGFGENRNNSKISLDPLKTSGFLEEDIISQALRPNAPTGMSAKAREKLPAQTPLKVSWGGNEALKVICKFIIPTLKLKLNSCWSNRAEHKFDKFFIVKQIEHCNLTLEFEASRLQISYDFLPDTQIDILKLTWSELSLGWYMSMLYWDIFSCSDLVKTSMKQGTSIISNLSSSISYLSRFASSWVNGSSQLSNDGDTKLMEYVKRGLPRNNSWAITQTKLFDIELGSGSFSPFGIKLNTLAAAVNNLTNTLVRRLSGFRTTNRSSVTSLNGGLDEIPERAKPVKRPSAGSIHSLNSLNRARSYTPRNSFST